MNCDWVEEHLSAYIDNELAAQERLKFDSHCDQCDSCRALAAEYQAIGRLMRQSEAGVDTNSLWERVEHRLDDDRVVPISTKSQPRNWVYAILATAASVAVIWFIARNPISEHNHSDTNHEHAALAVDFQEVIRTAKLEPKVAVAKLVSKYQGKELDAKATASYLGYEPTLFKSIPEGFSLVSTHVLNMPCCKCSASICERADGTSLVVFEHKDEQPVWFGELPSIETQCSGRTCKIVEASGQLAVSWKNDDRQLTMVGANDLAEVNNWVKKMQF
jgi:Putative zinc-finger